ncbi:hypothetical protein [Natrinema gari]|uniref:Uncharacterized protein n=1 Tax=Natrinema gari JCM 14663 TaxID=1230459 RepID=L9YZ99_9EURY|nr:hypothetical protein [Natrinema gari]ELY79434.1 hypothetical protein C486_10544 [Natrinema gari JCM 14663]
MRVLRALADPTDGDASADATEATSAAASTVDLVVVPESLTEVSPVGRSRSRRVRDESGLEGAGRAVRSSRRSDVPRSERSRSTGIRLLESGEIAPVRSRRVVPEPNRWLLEATTSPSAVGSGDADAGSMAAADG